MHFILSSVMDFFIQLNISAVIPIVKIGLRLLDLYSCSGSEALSFDSNIKVSIN